MSSRFPSGLIWLCVTLTLLNSIDSRGEEPSSGLHTRAWGGIGPVGNLNGDPEIGGRLSLGGDVLLGNGSPWILSAQLALPYTGERNRGNGSGRVTRLSYLMGPGHALVPELLYLQVLAGISVISGESPAFYYKLKPTFGASLSFLQGEAGHFLWGASLTYEHTDEARDAIANAGATLGCGVLGGGPDTDCTSTGVAPARDMLALNFLIGFGS